MTDSSSLPTNLLVRAPAKAIRRTTANKPIRDRFSELQTALEMSK